MSRSYNSLGAHVARSTTNGVAWLGLGVLGGAALAAASMYGLALLALRDGQRPEFSGTDAKGIDRTAAGRVVTLDSQGAARIQAPGQSTATLRGHGAPLVSARFVGNGRAVVTVDADGGVLLTDAGSAAALPDAVYGAPGDSAGSFGAGLLARLGDRLWSTYGRPLAHVSLAARRHLVLCGTAGTFHLQPLDDPAARVAFAARQGPYQKGYQEIAYPKYERYVDDAADLARIIRHEKEPDFSYAHDLAVQTALLTACGQTVKHE